jgi:hypothetical protein
VFQRTPDDGLYPRIKAVKNLNPSDVSQLAKLENWDTIKQLIEE